MAGRPGNNFDCLRILAALAVLLSHAIPLSDGSDRQELLFRWSGGQTTGGSAAVAVFFVMSGYLVTASLLRARSPLQFAAFRALRILPALWFILPVLAFVVGPLVSTWPTQRYLASPLPYIFVLRNMVFLHTESLPGVFAANPYPGVMDGSLWTLRYEVGCYAVLLMLGLAGMLRTGWLVAIYAATLAACLCWPADARLPLAAAFAGGALLQLAGGARRPLLAAACAAGWCLALRTSHYTFLAAMLAPCAILAPAAAARRNLPDLAKFGDVSYGLYIYAFPVQQIVALRLGPHGAWYWNAAIAAPLAIACAFLSWHLIERPALGLKQRLFAGRLTPQAVSPAHPAG